MRSKQFADWAKKRNRVAWHDRNHFPLLRKQTTPRSLGLAGFVNCSRLLRDGDLDAAVLLASRAGAIRRGWRFFAKGLRHNLFLADALGE